MQIILKNVYYNKFKNINLNINDNKITGIIGLVGSGKTDLSMLLGKRVLPTSGNIDYIPKILEDKIGIISNFSYEEMLDGSVKDFIVKKSVVFDYKIENIDERVEEVLKMVGLNKNILDKQVFCISQSEKIKILLSQTLLFNPELIILDGVIEELDSKSRTKLYKLIIKLKKFYNKTIVITSSDVDNIYEILDDIVILNDGIVIGSGDKFEIYNDETNNQFLPIPLTIEFKNKVKEKLNVNLGDNDSINELIKAIYREIR